MKYIDADKLIAEIERRKAILDTESPFGIGGRIELELVIDTITSLQQEQPEVDIEKEIAEHAINMPHSEFAHDSECREDEGWAMKEFRYFYELGLNARKK